VVVLQRRRRQLACDGLADAIVVDVNLFPAGRAARARQTRGAQGGERHQFVGSDFSDTARHRNLHRTTEHGQNFQQLPRRERKP
jgi:hypothetical protein